jgi:hypothetical protein
MIANGAPLWSLYLMLYIATKPSRIDLFGAVNGLHATFRITTCEDDGREEE